MFTGLIPLAEPSLYRVSYGDRASRPADLRAEATGEEVRAVVRERFGADVEIAEIRWAPRFWDDSRLAAKTGWTGSSWPATRPTPTSQPASRTR